MIETSAEEGAPAPFLSGGPGARPEKEKDTKESLSKLALDLLAANDMRSPSHIDLGRIARNLGVDVRFGDTGRADARTVRSGNEAWIVLNEKQRGTERARFSCGHELCHFLRHPDSNAIERIHGTAEPKGHDYVIENHANWFSSNALMPEPMILPYCTDSRPTFRHIDRVGSVFGTSRQATGKRYAGLATSACAFLECKDGIVKFATRSDTFRGIAKGRRKLEETTFAAALSRGEAVSELPRRVARGTWGSDDLDVEMIEQVSFVPESGWVLVLLWHA